MSETTGKTSSALAVTEKRPHKPGGCVGIFFQLFDWNRRFARKKLFSRKLLTPDRAKHVSKKFEGDEKMPKSKLHLIGDENNGGFSNKKKNGSNVDEKHEMKSPSLVARLMGLDSMPTANRVKPKNAPLPCDLRDDGLTSCSSEFNKEDQSLDKRIVKSETRPQKLQKTGVSDKQHIVTRFGAEALQIKSVLSRSRKHQHHKLASPLKSPRASSAKSALRASRLIDAATRILEPGLQATNRAKSAITYTSSTSSKPRLYKNDITATDGVGVVSPEYRKPSCYNVIEDRTLKGQTPCRNCGSLIGVLDLRQDTEENHPSRVSYSNCGSPQEQGKNKPTSLHHERGTFQQRNRDESAASLTPRGVENVRRNNEVAKEKPVSFVDKVQWDSANEPGRSSNDKSSAYSSMSMAKDGIPWKANGSNIQSRRPSSSSANSVTRTKDFVSLNRNLIGHTRPRLLQKMDNSNSDTDRKSCIGLDDSDSFSPLKTSGRKKRPISGNGQVESRRFVNGSKGKQKGPNAVDSMNRFCGEKRGVNSPLRENSRSQTGSSTNERIIKKQICFGSSRERDVVGNRSADGRSVDALGALLAQKLKELTYEEEDEHCSCPKKSTAMILQELITALTAGQSAPEDAHMFDADNQVKAKPKWTSVGLVGDGDHLSPGSVLEASFSNDSCFSSSLDESAGGNRLHLESMDCCAYDQLQQTQPETDQDLLDSATSLNEVLRGGYKIVVELLNQVSRLLGKIDCASLGITRNKLAHANQIILNVELLFGNTIQRDSNGNKRLLLDSLLDELDILAAGSSTWTNLNYLPGFEETKEGNTRFRRFLFDCMMEYLDTNYGMYPTCGFKYWRRFALDANAEIRIREEVVEAIRSWTELAGMLSDDVIELEMSRSLGKWTDFDIEAYENGVEIESDILKVLVEEVVEELRVSRMESFSRSGCINRC